MPARTAQKPVRPGLGQGLISELWSLSIALHVGSLLRGSTFGNRVYKSGLEIGRRHRS